MPKSGHAGCGHADRVVVAPDILLLAREIGARADEAHRTEEDVENLRQFVEAVFADDTADACDARVVSAELGEFVPFLLRRGMLGEVLFQHLVGVDVHGTELITGELFAVFADALCIEERRARRVQFNENTEDKDDGQQKRHEQDAADEVKYAFNDAVVPPREVVADLHEHDFLAEERVNFDAAHRCTDEVRDIPDIPHVRLDARDEVLQHGFRHAGCRDDDVLDVCFTDEFGRPVHRRDHGAAVPHDFLARIVVDDTDEFIPVAEVPFEIAQDGFGGFARADDDDRLGEELIPFEDLQHDIPQDVDVKQRQHAEDDEVEP